jgi:flagellar biosynthesis protein FlhA
MLGVGFGGLAMILSRRQGASASAAAAEADRPAGRPGPLPDAAPQRLLSVDPIRVEFGYALLHLVEPSRQADLMERIAALRRRIAAELGLLVPPIRLCDNLRLGAHGYAVLIRGSMAAEGRLFAGQLLAVAEGAVTGKLLGREADDPATGLPAVWINPTQQGRAEMMNYTVLSPAAVLMRHLGAVIRRRAADLLTRQQTVRMLDELRPHAGDLVREVTEKLNTGRIQKVLQSLLREGVSILDLEGILEALSDAAETTQAPAELVEATRAALAGSVGRQFCGPDGRLWCVCLAAPVEEALTAHAGDSPGGAAELPAEIGRRVTESVAGGLEDLRRQGRTPVVLCAPQVRRTVREAISAAEPAAVVLAYNEVDSVDIQPIADVGTPS